MQGERAIAACIEYNHWAREIRRLTVEIGEVECPREAAELEYDPEDPTADPDHRSHFRVEREVIVSTGGAYPEPRGPRTLDEIAAAVKDCPACARLCALIAERCEARKRWGVAKRKVRAIARLAGAERAGSEG